MNGICVHNGGNDKDRMYFTHEEGTEVYIVCVKNNDFNPFRKISVKNPLTKNIKIETNIRFYRCFRVIEEYELAAELYNL